MDESLKMQCEKFIRTRDLIKETFQWDDRYLIPICANLFVSSRKEADPTVLLRCRDIIDKNTGLFSNFRGNAKLPQICMLAVSEDPEARFDKAVVLYEKLKKEFQGSEYLAFAAMILAEMVSVEDAEHYIKRGGEIYRRMKKEHPFLTSSEDSVFAVLLAFSEKENDKMIADMEHCYQELKQTFSDSNAVQSVTHVLSFMDASWEEQCGKVKQLYARIGECGRKYSKHFELAVLAAAAILPVDNEKLINDTLEIDEFLAGQKGYKGFWGIDKKTRLMHAVMLAIDNCTMVGEVAAITGTLSMIAAQQAAMCGVMAACIASSTVASSHS